VANERAPNASSTPIIKSQIEREDPPLRGEEDPRIDENISFLSFQLFFNLSCLFRGEMFVSPVKTQCASGYSGEYILFRVSILFY
jgi:hypothetical protein